MAPLQSARDHDKVMWVVVGFRRREGGGISGEVTEQGPRGM